MSYPHYSTECISESHIERQRRWSAKTFGPDVRPGVVEHIRKELKEIEETNYLDLGEWVDVIILGLDGAWRSGAEPHEIIAAIKEKQTRNEARTWPDWRTAGNDVAIEHDRSKDE
jgi:hypothetical protein